jgi:hypothetical protein
MHLSVGSSFIQQNWLPARVWELDQWYLIVSTPIYSPEQHTLKWNNEGTGNKKIMFLP